MPTPPAPRPVVRPVRPEFTAPAPQSTAVVVRPKATLVPRSPRRGMPPWVRLVAIGAAVALLIVIGAAAFRAFNGGSGGAGSPDGAVRNLADALSREDAPAALTLLPPDEVRSVKKVFDRATAKASKAGLLRASNPFGGLDLKVTDLRFDVQKPAKDVAKVTIQAGRASYVVDEKGAQTPIKSLMARSRENSGDDTGWGKWEADLAPSRDRAPLVVMVVRQRGRWYVSPAYTLLEGWRQANGLPGANFGLDLSKVATGSPSPEAAINDFSAAVQAYDSSRIIDLLSPAELGGAARRYRQAILAGVDPTELKRTTSLRVSDSHLVVQNRHGASAEVAVTSASGTSSSHGDFARWSLEGTCLNVISSSDRSNNCLAQLDPEVGLAGVAEGTQNFFVSVTSFHGKWYVSPVQTALRYLELLVDKVTDRQVLAMTNLRQFAKPDGAIAPGAPMKGSLEQGQYGVYTYDVASPGPVLACTTEGVDVGASLYGPNGQSVDEVTDSLYLADQVGTYRVVVRGFNTGRTNNFEVTAKPVPVQDMSLPGDASGSVGPNCDGKILRFNATAGDHILIQGKLPQARPLVFDARGYGSTGRVFTPQASGSFMLAITDAGAYSVHLEQASGNFLMQYGRVQGTVARGGTTEYQLYATAGDRLKIAAAGTGGFDGRMELVNPAGTILSSADDTNGRDPAITYSFTADGVYRVRVSGYQGQAGSFSVSVS